MKRMLSLLSIIFLLCSISSIGAIATYADDEVTIADGIWRFTESGHWHSSPYSSTNTDYAKHSPGPEATDSTPQTCTVCGYAIAPAKNISISETNFPDPVFRQVIETYDTDKDGYLSGAENEQIKRLTIGDTSGRAKTLQGIAYLTSLEELHCADNDLTTLDLRRNTNLIIVDCDGNHLTELLFSVMLYRLNCSDNELTHLDFENNMTIAYLNCSDNKLSSLDLSDAKTLHKLYCSGNSLTSLDISLTTNLVELQCSDNKLTNLDVKKQGLLASLDCADNELTELNVENNAVLNSLDCSGNSLTSLEIRKNRELNSLNCSDNNLESLYLFLSTNLKFLNCSGNALTSLDLGTAMPIKALLYCKNNAYGIYIDPDIRTFDLNTLPGDIIPSRIISLKGAVRRGNILTLDPSVAKIVYKYDLDGSAGLKTAVFTLNVMASPHTAHSDGVKQSGKTATHKTAGWKDYYKCNGCEKLFEEASCETEITDLTAWKTKGGRGYLPRISHSYGTEWFADKTGHWHECTCGERSDFTLHTQGPEATEKSPQTCVVCGYVIAPATEHTVHRNGVKKSGKTATKDSAGWKDYYKCDCCEKLFEESTCETEIIDLDVWKAKGGRGYLPPITHSDGTDEKTEVAEITDETNITDKAHRRHQSIRKECKRPAFTVSSIEKRGNTSHPKTGSNENFVLWFALILLSCGGIAGLWSRRRKQDKISR